MNSPMHFLSRNQPHFGWDRELPPAVYAAPGDIVCIEAQDASGGQITPQSRDADLSSLNPDRVNPLHGPVFIDGAQPGDVLKVSILSLETADWGWTGNIPGFGLLASHFTRPRLHIWDLSAGSPAVFRPGAKVPLTPFPGILGVCPSPQGTHGAICPRRVGGNMDCRDLVEGAEILLPVEVEGALFSAGDGHAAQGDGEICGTALETPMQMTLKLDLLKGMDLEEPVVTTPPGAAGKLQEQGYEITLGIGPDLLEASRQAALAMVRRVASQSGMDEADAYLLLSVCADLRIKEIVDLPNLIVGCHFPTSVLQDTKLIP